ncbi:MAG: hypothetical protein MUE39_01595 [Gammaproteobacteria bacterium]|nr:hypothetical protein [Gammaproteobacteria bacterium]
MTTRRFAQAMLAVIGVAVVVGAWVSMLPPDDLQTLPSEPADLRLGPRAAEAGRRCRQELLATQPGLPESGVLLFGVAPVPGDGDVTLLRVEGRFREPAAVGEPRVMHFRCLVSAAGLRALEVHPAEP